MPHSALKRSKFIVHYRASGTPTSLQADAHLRGLTSGKLYTRRIVEDSFTTNRSIVSLQDPQEMPEDCEVLGARLHGSFGTLKRGQFFARAFFGLSTTAFELMAGYVSRSDFLSLGQFESSLSGRGYLDWQQDGNDVAGSSDTTVNLGLANTRRVIWGVLVKYHADGNAATRTIILRLRDVADTSGPTGFSIAADVWESPTLTLTVNEEGIIYVTDHGFVSLNDAGTITYANTASAPSPFPLYLESGETADLIVDIGTGQAGDDYDVFTLIEEWIVE